MDTHITVAIDGPSGAGKSTIARAAARRFGLIYVDTGAIYRTVGLACERAGADCSDTAAVQALLPELKIELAYDAAGEQRMLLNGEDVSDTIRLPEVSLLASRVSALPVVRTFLLDMQRDLARTHSAVMDGRDIGTVVLPDAGLKIFLSASAECRAQRRYRQLQEKGIEEPYADVLRELEQREHMVNVGVNAAVGQEAEDVQGGIEPLALVDGAHQSRILEEIAVLNRLGDAGQLLIYDAACTHI